MSATGRSDVRETDDFYETPAWVVDAILPHLPSGGRVLDPGCGSGAILRAIMATPPFVHADLHGVEIDEKRAEDARDLFSSPSTPTPFFGDALRHHVMVGDFTCGVACPLMPFDLVVGNPPFKYAMAFVLRSLDLARPFRGTVAMLLRMNWLASQERMAFHREQPADLFVLPRRPSFCASLRCKSKLACGWRVMQRVDAPRARECPRCESPVLVTTSDSTEYAWFVWSPGRGGRWQILDLPADADSGKKEIES